MNTKGSSYTATFDVNILSVPAGGGDLSPGQYSIVLTNTDPTGFLTPGPSNTGGNYNLLWPSTKKTKKPYDTLNIQFTMRTAGYTFVAPGFLDVAGAGATGLTFGTPSVTGSQVAVEIDIAKSGLGLYTYTLNFQNGATPAIQFLIDPIGDVQISDID